MTRTEERKEILSEHADQRINSMREGREGGGENENTKGTKPY